MHSHTHTHTKYSCHINKILFMMLTLKYFYPLLSSRVPRQPQPYTMYVLLAHIKRSRSCQMYTLLNNNNNNTQQPSNNSEINRIYIVFVYQSDNQKSTIWKRIASMQVCLSTFFNYHINVINLRSRLCSLR